MQNRVTKKFLNKIYPPFAIMAYVYLVMQLFINAPNATLGIAIVVVMLIGPLIGFFFREAWRDAKWEVEQENQIMLNTLKDQ